MKVCPIYFVMYKLKTCDLIIGFDEKIYLLNPKNFDLIKVTKYVTVIGRTFTVFEYV